MGETCIGRCWVGFPRELLLSVKIDRRWSSVVKFGLTSRFSSSCSSPQVPRAVGVKGEEGEPSHPCVSCRVAGLRCTITVIDQGLSVSNYCKPCSNAHSRCSFRDEKRNSVVSRGTLIGMSVPSLRTQLKQLGTDADGALTTMERLIEDVLLLFQETVPLAYRTIQTALNPPDTATRGHAKAAAVVNPPSVLGRGHLAPRSIDRSQRGKKRPRSRTCTCVPDHHQRGPFIDQSLPPAAASPEKDNYGTSRGNLRRDSGLGAEDDAEDDDDYEEEVTTPSRLTKSRSRR
jgi:hypothetical protein